jgi:hypothetical protein
MQGTVGAARTFVLPLGGPNGVKNLSPLTMATPLSGGRRGVARTSPFFLPLLPLPRVLALPVPAPVLAVLPFRIMWD